MGDGLAVSLSEPPPSRFPSASPTPSGSSELFVFVAVGDELDEADGWSDDGAADLDVLPAEGVADGAGVSFVSADSSFAVSVFFALSAEDEPDALAEGLGESDGFAESLGASERVTQGPAANGLPPSSAIASLGVSPIPTTTAVGIAARAIALLVGMCSFVSNDFLGAA